jgi:hypothetical protein
LPYREIVSYPGGVLYHEARKTEIFNENKKTIVLLTNNIAKLQRSNDNNHSIGELLRLLTYCQIKL